MNDEEIVEYLLIWPFVLANRKWDLKPWPVLIRFGLRLFGIVYFSVMVLPIMIGFTGYNLFQWLIK